MTLTINQIFQNAYDEIKKSNFEKAINLYETIIKIEPDNYSAYFFLGIAMRRVGNTNEAIESYEKAIKLKPDFVDAYYNLGNILYFLKKFDKARINYEKAIKLNPNFENAYFNLGNTLKDLGELDSAEYNYKKVLSLNPNYPMQDSLQLVLKLRKLLLNVKKENRLKNNYKHFSHNLKFIDNPYITTRLIDSNLKKCIYDIKSKKFDETIDARFGKGRCSINFELFDEDNYLIKNLSNDLINICQNALDSKIYVYDSFFNILNTDGGTTPHNHIAEFDINQGLVNQKYSLVYYISTGDQRSSNPGVLKLYNPDKEILPKQGMIVIIPANQDHSAVYNGDKDRIMIGMNFYCI